MHVEHKPAPINVRVDSEHEAQHGWEFEIAVMRPNTSNIPDSTHTVTLSYRDHDIWTGGKMSPSHLIQQVVAYALRHHPNPLPPRFDAARLRYWFPRFDDEMRAGAVG